jgi:hypothetical protein
VIALAVVAIACGRADAPVDFTDPLTGPASRYLSIPFDKYALTPEGLQRSDSTSRTSNGLDRPIVKTRSGAYLSRDFVFEVSVRVPPDHGDIAFVGFGAARSNPLVDNEPTSAFVVRIHNLPSMPHFNIDAAVAVPNERGTIFNNHFLYLENMGSYRPGESMRFRIERVGDRLTLAAIDVPGASRTLSIKKYPGLFDSPDAYLFVANSAEGTTFSNFSVRKP